LSFIIAFSQWRTTHALRLVKCFQWVPVPCEDMFFIY
jgi:hypothetical protein